MEKLDLDITPEARKRIDDFIASSELSGCMVGLLQRTDGQWHIGGYGKDQVAELAGTYSEKGINLIYEVSGLEMVIPQIQLIVELKGKTLHRNGNGYTVIDREE